MSDVANLVNGMLEKVRPSLETIFESQDHIASQVKKGTKATKVSRYLYRYPLKLTNGGNYAKFSANLQTSAGSLGIGTNQTQTHLTGAYFYSTLAFRISQEQLDTTADTSQSIINILTDTLASGMVEAAVTDDIEFHQSGNGILTNPSSATNGTNQLTFADATDFLRVSMLRAGMCVSVWDSTGATERVAAVAAPIIISSIDWDNGVVTFNQNVTSLTVGDIIAFRGMAVYGPSTLVTAQSGFPGTVPVTTAGGIGGDSWRHGFPYMTDPTTSSYYFGRLKSTVTELIPNRVNAAGNAIAWDHAMRVQAKVLRRRDEEALRGLRGITSYAQRAAVHALGVSATTKLLTSNSFGPSVDFVPSNVGVNTTTDFGGIPLMVSKRQRADQIDFLNFSKIERVQNADAQFHRNPMNGSMLFEGRVAADGSVGAWYDLFVVQAYDYISGDSGCFARLDNLALPANWDAY